MNRQNTVSVNSARGWLLIACFVIFTAVLLWRVVDLQLFKNDFLLDYGNARSIRVVEIPAHRGMIVDRNDEPLAISTPVESVWANPDKVLSDDKKLPLLAKILEMDADSLRTLLRERLGRDFVYLKRQVTPDQSLAIEKLSIPGINLQQEYKRYYPSGELTSHLIGFTNVDDVGQEGLELAYNDWLQGTPGSKRVLKDRLGRDVENIESIQASKPGKKLVLSIDRRVQYLAFRELKAAVAKHSARSGSLVMLNSKTGEVMAMVGQPSFNPNNRSELRSDRYRNRAVTDVFEPGSTLKPFTVAAGLMSGMYTPHTMVNTSPGFYRVSNHTIRDTSNHGNIDITTVIQKSSNIGAAKIALTLGPEKIWNVLTSVGFGQSTMSGFPGESPGLFTSYQNWSELELATISFGYGISVTMLQLAHSYAAIANDGIQVPVSFLKVTGPVQGNRVLPVNITREVRKMLETVVEQGGTGWRAAITGYRVAGKTGTAERATDGGYASNKNMSLFAGMAPASNPRLVMVVLIDEPHGTEQYGGQVAAPVFARVMSGALRLLNIAPDDLPSINNQVVLAQSGAASGMVKD